MEVAAHFLTKRRLKKMKLNKGVTVYVQNIEFNEEIPQEICDKFFACKEGIEEKDWEEKKENKD